MKLVRYGPPGQEKPGLIDAAGQLRDLNRLIGDIGPDQFGDAALGALRQHDASALPAVVGSPRLGSPLTGVRKFIAIGLNFADHAAESNLPIRAEPGVGMGMKPPVYLKAGDEMTLGIDGLGKQRQVVVAFQR